MEECSSAWLHWTQGISSSGIGILFGFGAAQDCLSQQLMKTSILSNLRHGSQEKPGWIQTREQQKQIGPEHRLGKFVVLTKQNSISEFWICQRIHLQCQQLVTKAEDLSPKLRLHRSCQRMPRAFSTAPANSIQLTLPNKFQPYFLSRFILCCPSLFVLYFNLACSVYRKNKFC